ncbi:hypothetical protein [Variovorax atrisoli]|uniref:hypothetical protein n=1 Tax=Variovorax atrisoli TaxID=3394203 RepID=UPI00339690C3
MAPPIGLAIVGQELSFGGATESASSAAVSAVDEAINNLAMPIEVNLSVLESGQIAARLGRCEGLREALEHAHVSDGHLKIEVRHVLLLKDIYGDESTQHSSDLALWRGAESCSVLNELDLDDAEKVGYIGEWNLPFLRWLHGLAIETFEPVSICYEHERGDYLYEVAGWSADPQATDGYAEEFIVEN